MVELPACIFSRAERQCACGECDEQCLPCVQSTCTSCGPLFIRMERQLMCTVIQLCRFCIEHISVTFRGEVVTQLLMHEKMF